MNQHYERGKALFDLGRYEEAEKAFTLALSGSSDDEHAHRARALCLCNLERRQEGRVAAETAIRMDPDSWLNHYALAACLVGFTSARDWPTSAERAIQGVLRFAPDDADTWGLLAYLRSVENRWSEALDAANSGLAHEPRHISCLLHRAEALLAMDNFEEADASVRLALAIDPQSSRAFSVIGRIRLAQGRLGESEQHFLEALRIQPTNANAETGVRLGRSRWRRWLKLDDAIAESQGSMFNPPPRVGTPKTDADARILAVELKSRSELIAQLLGRIASLWVWLPKLLRARAVDEVTSVSRLLSDLSMIVFGAAMLLVILLIPSLHLVQRERTALGVGFTLFFMTGMTVIAYFAMQTRSWLYRQLACSKWKHTFVGFKSQR